MSQTTATERYESDNHGIVNVTYTLHVFGVTINSIRRDSDDKFVELTASEMKDLNNLLSMYREDAIAK